MLSHFSGMKQMGIKIRTKCKMIKLRAICLWMTIGTLFSFVVLCFDWHKLTMIEINGQKVMTSKEKQTVVNGSQNPPRVGRETTTHRPLLPRKAILHQNGLDKAGFSTAGRQRNDGAWYSMAGSVELYVYTAHFDDRKSIQGKPVVRVIAVSELDKNALVFCVVWFDSKRTTTISAKIIEVGAGVYRHEKLFIELIISCKISDAMKPTHVSIVRYRDDPPSFAVPVERGFQVDQPKKICICVSLSYWRHDPNRLIEWIEFQRLMGVDTIVVYNNSLALESQTVFRHYASQDPDFFEIRQSRNFITDRGELTYHLQMAPVINDCMYRYRKRFTAILVLDLDELIVPNTAENFQDMIQEIERRHPEPHVPFMYSFRNAYFFMDFAPRRDQPEQLVSLQYTKRAEYSEVGYSSKSIIGTNTCIAMHNHYCWLYTPKYRDYEVMLPYIEVDTDIAFLHHYKHCHLTDNECRHLFKTQTDDPRMLHFRDQLIKSVNPPRAALGLPLVS